MASGPDNHFNKAALSLGTAIASPNANGFLDAGVDLAGFLADWLVVPEGVLLPVEGLALEELLGNGSELFIAKAAKSVGVDFGKVHLDISSTAQPDSASSHSIRRLQALSVDYRAAP